MGGAVRALALVAGLFLALPMGPRPIHAQVGPTILVSDALQEIELTGGSVLIGRVVEVDGDRVVVETVEGVRSEVDRGNIRSVRFAPGRVVDGSYWRPDPNRTRLLLFSPTARMLRKGEGYISSFMLVLPFAAYGITDRITIAGGTPLIPSVVGRVIYLAPKVGVYQGEGFDLAAGALGFLATQEVDEGSVGIAYGAGTVGSPDRALTLGAGWGFAIGTSSDPWVSNEPVLLLGGELRVAPSVKLLTENFLVVGESQGILSGGVRFFGESLSADVGIATTHQGDWFPTANVVYNFGGRR